MAAFLGLTVLDIVGHGRGVPLAVGQGRIFCLMGFACFAPHARGSRGIQRHAHIQRHAQSHSGPTLQLSRSPEYARRFQQPSIRCNIFIYIDHT
jgi:hypothetical protein